MPRVTAIAVCVLLTLTASGQQRRYTVVLDNGSRISGTIVGDSAGYIDLKVTSPQVIRLGREQIESIEAVTYPVKKNSKTGGCYIRFSTGILSGKKEDGYRNSLSLHLSSGYQFRNGLAAGIGSGMEELDITLIPLYADLRYTPLNTGVSPWLWLKTGYGFPASDHEGIYADYYSSTAKSEGGLLFSTGAGISLFTWKRTAVTVGVGYRYQKVTLMQPDYWWGGSTVRETVTRFNRLEWHLGFVFM